MRRPWPVTPMNRTRPSSRACAERGDRPVGANATSHRRARRGCAVGSRSTWSTAMRSSDRSNSARASGPGALPRLRGQEHVGTIRRQPRASRSSTRRTKAAVSMWFTPRSAANANVASATRLAHSAEPARRRRSLGSSDGRSVRSRRNRPRTQVTVGRIRLTCRGSTGGDVLVAPVSLARGGSGTSAGRVPTRPRREGSPTPRRRSDPSPRRRRGRRRIAQPRQSTPARLPATGHHVHGCGSRDSPASSANRRARELDGRQVAGCGRAGGGGR